MGGPKAEEMSSVAGGAGDSRHFGENTLGFAKCCLTPRGGVTRADADGSFV